MDGHWEYCKFSGPAPSYSECNFEWKRLVNDVRKQVKLTINEMGIYSTHPSAIRQVNLIKIIVYLFFKYCTYGPRRSGDIASYIPLGYVL